MESATYDAIQDCTPTFDDHHYVSESFHLVTTTIALDPRVGVLRKLKFVALSIALCIAQYTVLFTLAHSLLYGRCTDGVECALGFFCSKSSPRRFRRRSTRTCLDGWAVHAVRRVG